MAAVANQTGSFPFELPDDLPKKNDMAQVLFEVYDEAEALRVLLEDAIIYLMPWGARYGGLAAYEKDIETSETRPLELEGDEVRNLLENHRALSIPLLATPAWLLTERTSGARVSWHARVRWTERVGEGVDPAPRIREAFEQGVSVGIDYGIGRYYPPEDVVICAVEEGGEAVVTTVYRPDSLDDLGANHLVECEDCGLVFDPGETESCPW